MRITEYRRAFDIILNFAERFKVRRKERVRLDESLGRIVAEDIHAPIDIPPFDRATMDGYAVVAADTFYADEDSPAELSLLGEVRAGEFPDVRVERGTCVAISTGAPMPEGADSVVKVENAEDLCEKVRIFKSVAPSENVQRAGSDIRKGELIISEGTLLTPCRTGVLAACGINEVVVRGKPRVAIISTGDELVDPLNMGDGKNDGQKDAPLPKGKIYDVNMRTLSDAVSVCGCVPLPLGIACDDADDVRGKIEEAVRKADIILVSGSTSAGKTDIVPTIIYEHGELVLHGVDIKPGKPLAFGIFRGKPIFALPGNPTSALLSFSLFVAPLLYKCSTAAYPTQIKPAIKSTASTAAASPTAEEGILKNRTVKARTTMRIISEKGRNEFIFVRLSVEGDIMLATPILKGSGAITTLADADGYIFVEKGREIIEEGEQVEVFLQPALTDEVRQYADEVRR